MREVQKSADLDLRLVGDGYDRSRLRADDGTATCPCQVHRKVGAKHVYRYNLPSRNACLAHPKSPGGLRHRSPGSHIGF